MLKPSKILKIYANLNTSNVNLQSEPEQQTDEELPEFKYIKC